MMNKPLSILLKTLPNAIHTELLSRVFNHALKGQWFSEQLDDINGKRIAITINDTATELLFMVEDRQFKRANPKQFSQPWHVKISGNLEEFWKLATRAEDPDTLFFNRTLSLEGETETGLFIKNLLDSADFEPETHLKAVLGEKRGGRIFKLLQKTGIDQRLRARIGLPGF
jgi:predicted lipid carrier protein YhbT